MKTKILATVAILGCSLMLAPGILRADQNDWYQGRQGQWVQQQKQWEFHDVNGNRYRHHGNSWGWYNGRKHGAAGSAYHDRAPGNTQTYNQYQNTH